MSSGHRAGPLWFLNPTIWAHHFQSRSFRRALKRQLNPPRYF